MKNYNIALEQQLKYLDESTGSLAYFREFYTDIYGVKAIDAYSAWKGMLAVGDTYFLGAEAYKLLRYGMKTYPTDALIEEPPTQTGFCWLEEPAELAKTINLAGFQWHQQTETKQILIFPYITFDGDAFPFGLATIHPGDTTDDAMNRNVVLGKKEEAILATMSMLVAAAFFAFSKQRIMHSTISHAYRQLGKRAIRAKRDNTLINVIQLRTREYKGGEGSRDVEWMCRWLVRGHWRKLEKRAVWVTPYIKGPQDKPLKLSEHDIFAVVR